MNHNHRLRAELDHHELAALQRFVMAVNEEPHLSNPRVEVGQVSRGSEGQVFVPVMVSGKSLDVHLAMLMEHKAEQLYKQSGCRFVLVQQLETDPERRSFVWGDGIWQTVP
jgi:hypothetical protein